jgi:hypothetical protein
MAAGRLSQNKKGPTSDEAPAEPPNSSQEDEMSMPIVAREPFLLQALAQVQSDFASIARLAGGARLQKAADIASSGLVFQTRGGVFAIGSQANPLGSYQVVIASDRMTCTCPDFPRAPAHQTECKHILAVYLTLNGRLVLALESI